jgi:hypothetical protein
MGVLRIVLFVLPFLLGVLGAHYVLYLTVVKFFDLTHRGAKLGLLLGPLLLTLSFVFANLLLRLDRNVVFEGYGLVSVVWLGLFIQLVQAAGLVWLFYLIARLIGRVPDMRVVVLCGLGLAVAVTAYGAWNARRPQLTRIAVPLENLPDHWRGRTVVQLSDVHLGVVRGVGYARDLVARVNALQPALVLITGDLFDGMGGRFDELIAPFAELEAEHGTYFVTGNHEGYAGLERTVPVIERSSIRLLDDEVVDVAGLQLVGIGFPEHDGAADPQAVAAQIDPERPSILLYHTPTDVLGTPGDRGAQQNRTYFSPDTRFDFAQRHGIDLQLSGHTHQGQFFPFTLLTRWIYGGYDHGLHRSGDFHLYTSSGTGTWGPPLRLASRSEIVAVTLEPQVPGRLPTQ